MAECHVIGKFCLLGAQIRNKDQAKEPREDVNYIHVQLTVKKMFASQEAKGHTL